MAASWFPTSATTSTPTSTTSSAPRRNIASSPAACPTAASAQVDFDWGEAPSVSLAMEFRDERLTAFFRVVFGGDHVGIDLNGIHFSDDIGDAARQPETVRRRRRRRADRLTRLPGRRSPASGKVAARLSRQEETLEEVVATGLRVQPGRPARRAGRPCDRRRSPATSRTRNTPGYVGVDVEPFSAVLDDTAA